MEMMENKFSHRGKTSIPYAIKVRSLEKRQIQTKTDKLRPRTYVIVAINLQANAPALQNCSQRRVAPSTEEQDF